jgi:hypothetical protein
MDSADWAVLDTALPPCEFVKFSRYMMLKAKGVDTPLDILIEAKPGTPPLEVFYKEDMHKLFVKITEDRAQLIRDVDGLVKLYGSQNSISNRRPIPQRFKSNLQPDSYMKLNIPGDGFGIINGRGESAYFYEENLVELFAGTDKNSMICEAITIMPQYLWTTDDFSFGTSWVIRNIKLLPEST